MIYGYCVSNIEVSYWPIPQTLTFKNEDVQLDTSFTFIDCCNNNYLYKSGQDVYVYNINTSASTLVYTIPTGDTLSKAKIGINNIILICAAGTTIFTVYIDSKNYSNTAVTSAISTPTSFGLVKAEKKVYFRNGNTIILGLLTPQIILEQPKLLTPQIILEQPKLLTPQIILEQPKLLTPQIIQGLR